MGLLYSLWHRTYGDLAKNTVGFIALGSPFRGTKMQGLADRAAQLMVLAGSHKGILDELAFGNTTLRDKLHEFCQAQDLTSVTRCFFELYKTDYGKRFKMPGAFQGMVCSCPGLGLGWKRADLCVLF